MEENARKRAFKALSGELLSLSIDNIRNVLSCGTQVPHATRLAAAQMVLQTNGLTGKAARESQTEINLVEMSASDLRTLIGSLEGELATRATPLPEPAEPSLLANPLTLFD